MLHTALEAATRLQASGVSVEVIDLQTLQPLDWDTVFSSVAKTGRLVIVQEDNPFASVASEIAARVSDQLFWSLDAPIRRVTSPDVHVPYTAVLEDAYVPAGGGHHRRSRRAFGRLELIRLHSPGSPIRRSVSVADGPGDHSPGMSPDSIHRPFHLLLGAAAVPTRSADARGGLERRSVRCPG